MKRKAYVRVTEHITEGLTTPIEIICGVELRPLVAITVQYNSLRANMMRVLTPSRLRNYADDTIALALEERLGHAYPGRSYFIEVGRGNMDEYVQVFEP